MSGYDFMGGIIMTNVLPMQLYGQPLLDIGSSFLKIAVKSKNTKQMSCQNWLLKFPPAVDFCPFFNKTLQFY
jgi:hypothetical protein